MPAVDDRVAADPADPGEITSLAQWWATCMLNSETAGIGNVRPADDEESQRFAAEVRRLNPDWQPGRVARVPLAAPMSLVRGQDAPRPSSSTSRPIARARETRPSSRRRAAARSASSSSGEDGEPPRRRACAYCGRALEGERRNKLHCSPSHRVMACKARKREREQPAGLTPEALEASFAGLNSYAERLPDDFATTVLVELEASGYAHRLPDGSFAPTAWARGELRNFCEDMA